MKKRIKGIFNKYLFPFKFLRFEEKNFRIYFCVTTILEEIFLNEISFNKDVIYVCIKMKLLKKLILLKETCII